MIPILRWAGLLGSIAISLLAISSHVLSKHYTLEQIASINTAAYIQLIHSVALLAIGLYNKPSKQTRIIARLMLVGVCFFSFSIYILVFNKISELSFVHFLWPVTPIGGLLLITSWVLIILNAPSFTTNQDQEKLL
jgi:uncharacterized membrane protein YgdD (TMEM256/DUF423 family)